MFSLDCFGSINSRRKRTQSVDDWIESSIFVRSFSTTPIAGTASGPRAYTSHVAWRVIGVARRGVKAGKKDQRHQQHRDMPYRRTIAEEYDYDCLFCRINYPTPGGEYLGSTENNCKGCLALIEQAEELLRPLPPPGGAMQFSDYSKGQ